VKIEKKIKRGGRGSVREKREERIRMSQVRKDDSSEERAEDRMRRTRKTLH
jgi:hypothetical protein